MIDSPVPPIIRMPVSPPTVLEALTFGVPAIDGWLNGGLRRDGVHEFYAAPYREPGAEIALALLLGARACAGKRRLVLWLRIRDGKSAASPHAPGLSQLGVNPDSVLLMDLPDLKGLLIAAVESVGYGGAAAMVIEAKGRAPQLDLTASRRLTLAAEQSGTMVLIARNAATPVSSAAHSRWQVASAPSIPLAANAPGNPMFDLRLLRQRGGPDGLNVQLEWDREQAIFRTALSGRQSAVPTGRAVDRRRHRAA